MEMSYLYQLGMGIDQVPWEQFEASYPYIDFLEVGVNTGNFLPSEIGYDGYRFKVWFIFSVFEMYSS
jgi:hypothetical protein